LLLVEKANNGSHVAKGMMVDNGAKKQVVMKAIAKLQAWLSLLLAKAFRVSTSDVHSVLEE
jgi:hypothetical protein